MIIFHELWVKSIDVIHGSILSGWAFTNGGQQHCEQAAAMQPEVLRLRPGTLGD
jgi:hypothetical protein